MIYQPVNAYPNNTTVDVANTDGQHPLYFEWQFHGNYMTKCSIFIWDMNNMGADAIELPYTFNPPVYGDDMVKVEWDEDTAQPNLTSSAKLKNGTEYLWKVIQYEDDPTMFVKRGKVQKAKSNNAIILQNDMHLWFNNNTQCYLIIDEEKRRITDIHKVGDISQEVERNDTEMEVVVENPFTFIPQEGESYSVYTSGSATINGFYFKARTTPKVTVSFTNASKDLDNRGRLRYRLSNFKGTYQQKEGVPIKYHYWQLYRILGRKKELIIQTDDTYNSRLEFQFDGFVSGETYELCLNVVTQDGQYVSNDGLYFQTFYNKPKMGEGIISLSWNPDHNAARINVQDIKFSQPELSKDCKYDFHGEDRGILHVMEGTIDYTHIGNEELNLHDFTLFSKFCISTERVGPIISLLFDPINDILRDSYYISIDERTDEQSLPTGVKDFMLHLVKDGYDIVKHKYFSTKLGKKPCFQGTRVVDDQYEYIWPGKTEYVNDPDKGWIWKADDSDSGVYLDTFNTDAQFFIMDNPDNSGDTFKLVLTPKKAYLRAVGAKKTYVVDGFDIGDATYHCLRLYKDVYYDYNILLNRAADEDNEIYPFLYSDDTVLSEEIGPSFHSDDAVVSEEMHPLPYSNSFVPSYDAFEGTILYTPFTNGSLTSSNLEGVNAENLKGYLVYREKIGEGIKHRVGILDLSIRYIEDFMVTNDNIYKWELIPIGEQDYGMSIETSELMVKFDEWTIGTYEPDPNQKDVYLVDKGSIWKFGLNTEGHDIEQNILKEKLEGLGQYPKFTIQNRNYITGGLTAYLANMTNNDIYDTIAIKRRFPKYSPYRIASDIYWEPADKLIEWNKLVASGKEVIIRDIKGHVWRAQIDANSAVIDIYAQTSPTTIEFTFTEVGSTDNCAVYLKE